MQREEIPSFYTETASIYLGFFFTQNVYINQYYKLMTKSAKLILENGTIFSGVSFGAEGETIGEVCFNTGMTGYQEILTDPSYCGQLVTITYPHIGNYCVN